MTYTSRQKLEMTQQIWKYLPTWNFCWWGKDKANQECLLVRKRWEKSRIFLGEEKIREINEICSNLVWPKYDKILEASVTLVGESSCIVRIRIQLRLEREGLKFFQGGLSIAEGNLFSFSSFYSIFSIRRPICSVLQGNPKQLENYVKLIVLCCAKKIIENFSFEIHHETPI